MCGKPTDSEAKDDSSLSASLSMVDWSLYGGIKVVRGVVLLSATSLKAAMSR